MAEFNGAQWVLHETPGPLDDMLEDAPGQRLGHHLLRRALQVEPLQLGAMADPGRYRDHDRPGPRSRRRRLRVDLVRQRLQDDGRHDAAVLRAGRQHPPRCRRAPQRGHLDQQLRGQRHTGHGAALHVLRGAARALQRPQHGRARLLRGPPADRFPGQPVGRHGRRRALRFDDGMRWRNWSDHNDGSEPYPWAGNEPMGGYLHRSPGRRLDGRQRHRTLGERPFTGF